MTDLQVPAQPDAPTPPVPPPPHPQAPSDNARPFSALAITTFTFAMLALLLSWVPVADFFLVLPFVAVSLTFLGFALHATAGMAHDGVGGWRWPRPSWPWSH